MFLCVCVLGCEFVCMFVCWDVCLCVLDVLRCDSDELFF